MATLRMPPFWGVPWARARRTALSPNTRPTMP